MKAIKGIQELNTIEKKEISGGDGLTRRVFNYLGKMVAYIQLGNPHDSYGVYAGM